MQRHRSRSGSTPHRAGVVAVALLALTGLCFAALPARASTDAATAGASSDLPPAHGSAGGGAAGAAAGAAVATSTTSAHPPAELTATTLAPALGALTPTSPVLLEFYAHWCPTCRRFQPEYERASEGLSTGGGPAIFVARLDCANEAKLCATYGVQRFPTMILGSAADVAGLAKSAWSTYSGPLTGEAVEAWARSTAGAGGSGSGGNAAAAVQAEHAAVVPPATPSSVLPPSMLPSSARPGGRADLGDITKATTLAFQYALQAEAVHGEPGARDAFAAWVGLVAAAHPVQACREGAAGVAAGLSRTWPASRGSVGPPPTPDPSLASTPLCGPSTPISPVWDGCAPSRDAAARNNGRRGYTCGLWQAFHALAAGHPDAAAGGKAWLEGVAGYVRHFFQCSECAAHFTEMAISPDARSITSRRDAILWAWAAHNRVNARLAATEAVTPGDGDPAHPKLQWPPRTLCPACSAPATGPGGTPQWNEDAVGAFLEDWYRPDGKAAAAATATTAVLPRRALGDTHSSEGSRPLLMLAVVGLVCAGVVVATRPPPVRRGLKAAAH